MKRIGGIVGLVGILVGLSTSAEPAIILEVGEEDAPLTQQQAQALTTTVQGIGGVEKLEVEEGRLEATLDADSVTPSELQALLAQATDLGAPFEFEIVGSNLTPAEIEALQSAVAGTPVEVEVEVENGVQEIKIETSDPEEMEVAELEEPDDVEDPEVEEPDEIEVEEPDIDEPEIEEHEDVDD